MWHAASFNDFVANFEVFEPFGKTLPQFVGSHAFAVVGGLDSKRNGKHMNHSHSDLYGAPCVDDVFKRALEEARIDQLSIEASSSASLNC